ncbi:BTB/POZ domain-containing protein NPY1-like [Neltuma alba]|uniref:BTB/POZ domain-containing protein NPY1-like n=1 Tax=Neltuma alba TaxID=207710 RepID=UPI0010A2E54D|nr:BTB/POZ domain-containing protein NPY1-like [Prosopis alba]XP_028799157.1 BTB/POZ domain-containing protein NPY1-like [Prosopis alba]XP_028799158.1 BTB/POZ domain-containing protein NPY1-like [Prosopis alba]
MKFMKLGSKPGAFQADGKSIRYASSELTADIVINVGEVKFYLHKFPLLSKSNRLQKQMSRANEDDSDEIFLNEFPGGAKAFELCAKFCYGMTVTLNAYNVVAARCAAEYLEMTEDIERGNLIFKIEVFLNSSIFQSWKDSIIVLQTAKSLLPWSEDLKIIGRCIDSIASKTSVDPANITWSYTYNRKLTEPDRSTEHKMTCEERVESVPKDWWVEDICELDIDIYKRLMTTVKSKGRMDGLVIGEALKTYAIRWLPDSIEALVSEAHAWRNKFLVETIVCLLPPDNAVGCSCTFLLKLLKVAILVGVDESVKEELVKSTCLKLHEASIKDLLIPARPPQTTIYDVQLVQCLLNRYMNEKGISSNMKISEKKDKGNDKASFAHMFFVNMGRLADNFLAEIAHDPNLSLSSFVDLSQVIPVFARPNHDVLYRAIDIYLKEHPNMTKAERKKLCGLMDVKKLSVNASMHAAQNERLPLRVVVQVLFFEQVRASASVQALGNKNSMPLSYAVSTDEECEKIVGENCQPLENQMCDVKIKEEFPRNGKLNRNKSKSSRSGMQLLPSRSRRLFDKLWIGGKGQGENKSSETSGSSNSPTSFVPGSSSSRHRRHSVS